MNPLKTKYTLLFAESPADLDLQVNTLLDQDWRLYGSTFIDAFGRYCQAVILLFDVREMRKTAQDMDDPQTLQGG